MLRRCAPWCNLVVIYVFRVAYVGAQLMLGRVSVLLHGECFI